MKNHILSQVTSIVTNGPGKRRTPAGGLVSGPRTAVGFSRPLRGPLINGMVVCLMAGLSAPAAFAQNFGEWLPAVNVDPGGVNAVNTPALEGCPIEGPDGHLLFFASNRSGDLDVWVASRPSEGSPWQAPERLPFPVNVSPGNDFCPTPLPGNGLLFVSNRSNLCGGMNNPDIYYTRLHPVRGWLPPLHLGCEVNSPFEEFSPSLVESNAVTLLFFSSNRADSVNHDIYVSVLQADGSWGSPTPVDELNSPFQDSRPNVRKDGLEIVFDSTRDGGPPKIYSATRSTIFEPWSAPERLGENVNSVAAAETRPSLSRDGQRLYFGSTREGSSDIFVSRRFGPGKKTGKAAAAAQKPSTPAGRQ
jgi:hypothetical protein